MDSIAKINRLLKQKGITGAELSRRIGVSNSTYSIWNRRKSKPSPQNLKKIAEVLNVDINEVIEDENEQEPIASATLQELDKDTAEMLQAIKDNPGMRVLFSRAKDATPEQLLAIAQMINTFRNGG